MKRLIITFSLIFMGIFVFAQKPIAEDIVNMSAGAFNSFTIALSEPDKKIVSSQWEKFMKSNYKGKTKRNRKTGEIFTDDAKISMMSSNTIDVYARVYDNQIPNTTTITVWYDMGGAYVNSATHAEASLAAERMLRDFSTTVDVLLAENEVKSQEKKLKELESDLKKLMKDNENYHKKIEDAKALIEKMEQNIEVNLVDQENKRKEIDRQNDMVGSAKTALQKVERN